MLPKVSSNSSFPSLPHAERPGGSRTSGLFMRKMLKYYKPFLYLCLLDWFFGSWISAALQAQPPYNQRAAWAYQALYGLVVVAGLLLSDKLNHRSYALDVFRSFPRFFACGLLFVGYVEDLTFYLLLHVWNPHGYDFHGRFMPAELGGWLGWLTGIVSGGDLILKLPLAGAVVTSAIAIFASIGFLRRIK